MSQTPAATPPRDTALVTGASSGIGRALARRFAQGGYDLVLVARDEAALAAVARELRDTHGVAATVLVSDLSRPEAVDALAADVARLGLRIDVLVNNAGFGVKGPFLATPLDRELSMIDVQLGAMLRLTKVFLPAMVERGRGGVLTVASVYSFMPVAFQAVYGACKSFMASFHEALASEIAGSGVTLTLLCPGSTRTEFRQRAGVTEKRAGGSGMTAEAVAEAGFRGFRRGQRVVIPGTVNWLFTTAAQMAPAGWATRVLRMVNRKRGMTPEKRAKT